MPFLALFVLAFKTQYSLGKTGEQICSSDFYNVLKNEDNSKRHNIIFLIFGPGPHLSFRGQEFKLALKVKKKK